MTKYVYETSTNELEATIERPTERECDDVIRTGVYADEQYGYTQFFDEAWEVAK